MSDPANTNTNIHAPRYSLPLCAALFFGIFLRDPVTIVVVLWTFTLLYRFAKRRKFFLVVIIRVLI